MKRAGYREAVDWLAGNDDCYWLGENEPIPSVAAFLVAYLFEVDEAKLIIDLRRALKRAKTEDVGIEKPWTCGPDFGNQCILNRNGVMVADCSILHHSRTSEQNTKNAEDIVRAVNSHDDLVKALEEVRQALWDVAGCNAWRIADAAISRAKEQV